VTEILQAYHGNITADLNITYIEQKGLKLGLRVNQLEPMALKRVIL
jgi:hypothetical protein